MPVLDTLTEITAASIDETPFAARLRAGRLAARIAVDAPPVSYVATPPPSSTPGRTLEDVQGTMIGRGTGGGTARVMAAGGHILLASGWRSRVSEAELDEEHGRGAPEQLAPSDGAAAAWSRARAGGAQRRSGTPDVPAGQVAGLVPVADGPRAQRTW